MTEIHKELRFFKGNICVMQEVSHPCFSYSFWFFCKTTQWFCLFFFFLSPSFFRGASGNQVLQEGKNILGHNHTIIFTQTKSLCRCLFAYIKMELSNEPWVAGSVFLWQGMQSHIMTDPWASRHQKLNIYAKYSPGDGK